MDLMVPMQVESLGGKRYTYVAVDDSSRFTWVNFITKKSEVFEVFKELCQKIQREKDCGIIRIRSDHGKEFENSKFDEFCTSGGNFLGYSTNSRAYKVFNPITKVMMESINVVDDSIKEAYVTEDVGTSILMNDVLEDTANQAPILNLRQLSQLIKDLQSDFKKTILRS